MVIFDSFLRNPFAHRGLYNADAPENSLASFRNAIVAGFGIELDVIGLADHLPVVFHDISLARLTNRIGTIKDLNLRNLKEVYLKNGESIPTLEEVLTSVAGNVPILLEVKDDNECFNDPHDEFIIKVAEQVENYKGPIAVMAFNPSVVSKLKGLSSEIPKGLVTDDFYSKDWNSLDLTKRKALMNLDFLKTLDLDFISHNVKKINSAQVTMARNIGLPVICWTVRSKKEENFARKNFDNITFEHYLPDYSFLNK